MPVVAALTFQGRHRLSFPAARSAGKGIQPFGVLRRHGFWIPFPRPSASPGMTGCAHRRIAIASRKRFGETKPFCRCEQNQGVDRKCRW